MKVKYSRFRHNAKGRQVSRRRRDHDGKVVSTSMRSIQQMMMSRPVEVAVSILSSL